MRHGGKILIDQLRIQGVDRVYCVPGESFLAALDGLVGTDIETVVCRHESGAAMMAEADGKLTGRPGVAFVTRGPGATNAAAGVHVAFQDSTPMILFVGHVARGQCDREAFQEIDIPAMFAPLAKWAAQISATERIPEYVSRAFHIAMNGRPGPVVLALPEDMLSAYAEVADVPPATYLTSSPAHRAVEHVAARLSGAKRPLAIVGGGGWSASAAVDLAAAAHRLGVPVAASFRCQDYMDNRDPHYVGHVGIGIDPALAEAVRTADVLLALGTRLGEMTTSGYTLVDIPTPRQELIHIHPDPNEIGRVYRSAFGIACAPAAFVAALAKVDPQRGGHNRKNRIARLRNGFEAWLAPRETPGAVKMEQVVAMLSARLPENAIITNGAGNYAAWLNRYFVYKGWRTQLAPTSGSMGYGVPAAIAAKLRHPERIVVCVAGDGCLQMTLQELATAAQYGASILLIIVNNGMYGTLRMHQERAYPGRVSGTKILNPDFVALGRAYGAHAERVTQTEEFLDALERALDAGRLAVIELPLDACALGPSFSLLSTD